MSSKKNIQPQPMALTMSTPEPERENKTAVVKINAAASSSVPTLRDEVVRLAEAVEELKLEIVLLNRKSNIINVGGG